MMTTFPLQCYVSSVHPIIISCIFHVVLLSLMLSLADVTSACILNYVCHPFLFAFNIFISLYIFFMGTGFMPGVVIASILMPTKFASFVLFFKFQAALFPFSFNLPKNFYTRFTANAFNLFLTVSQTYLD